MIEVDRELTEKIIGAAIEVHRTLGGPGLREEVYRTALNWELSQLGLGTELEVPVPVRYKGMDLSDPNHPLRIDILVEKRVVIECKSISKYNPIFASQCLTYMRLGGYATGLVLNFGMKTVKEGLERIVNPQAEAYAELRCSVAPCCRAAGGGDGEVTPSAKRGEGRNGGMA